MKPWILSALFNHLSFFFFFSFVAHLYLVLAFCFLFVFSYIPFLPYLSFYIFFYVAYSYLNFCFFVSLWVIVSPLLFTFLNSWCNAALIKLIIEMMKIMANTPIIVSPFHHRHCHRRHQKYIEKGTSKLRSMWPSLPSRVWQQILQPSADCFYTGHAIRLSWRTGLEGCLLICIFWCSLSFSW